MLWKLSARRLIQLAKRFLENDKELSQRVAPLGMVITTLCDELKIRHVERMSNGACGLEEGDGIFGYPETASHVSLPTAQAQW